MARNKSPNSLSNAERQRRYRARLRGQTVEDNQAKDLETQIYRLEEALEDAKEMIRELTLENKELKRELSKFKEWE